ncbi:MAG: carboxymuconolactone decarboxylase family protein [Aggregatilineales bacterium]
MSDQTPRMSGAFQTFFQAAPSHAAAWMQAVRALDNASVLDKKTEELVHISLLAALRLESGLPFHVQLARQAGASRDEVISAILVGLPVVGQVVTQAIPIALAAYNADQSGSASA